jgi:DNA/RNA endonuclease YhcR with UshA esterase domain
MLSKAFWAAALTCALFGSGNFALGKDQPEYTALEAAKHIGETATVTDKVEGVYQAKGGNIFLNMGGKHPNQAFTVFIAASNASAFKDFKVYDGKTISVSGKIEEHSGKPEMSVKTPADITSKVDDLTPAGGATP